MIKPKLYKAKEKYTGETVIGYPFREYILYDTTQTPPSIVVDCWAMKPLKSSHLASNCVGIQGYVFDTVYIDKETLEEYNDD